MISLLKLSFLSLSIIGIKFYNIRMYFYVHGINSTGQIMNIAQGSKIEKIKLMNFSLENND